MAQGALPYYLGLSRSDDSDYRLRVDIQYNPRTGLKVYNVRLEGVVRSDQILRWRILVEGSSAAGDVKTVPVSLPLRKGWRDRVFKIREAYQFPSPLSLDKDIRPEIVELPGPDDFQPEMASPYSFLLPGDPFTLSVNVRRQFPNVEWIWTVDGDPGARLTGERFQQEAGRSKVYRVYARYRDSDFRTVSKQVVVTVRNPKDILDFGIRGPGRAIDDTAVLSLAVDIRKDWTDGKAEFRWYEGRDASGVPIRTGRNLVASPPLATSDYTVCAYGDGRRLGCLAYHQSVNVLAGPGDFEFVSPGTLYANRSAVIRTRWKNPQPEYWTWSVNGRPMAPKGRDTLLIPSPKPGMQVCVYPTLNQKGGEAMRKCLTLRDVRVMTVLPTKVEGRMSRCSGDRTVNVYTLKGGTLGSDVKAWVLYEGARRVRQLRPGSDTLRLAPVRTTQYRISTDAEPGRSFSFAIEVSEPPRLPDGLKGPASVCAGEPFRMEALGAYGPDVRWRWYRAFDGEGRPSSIGEGPSVRDSIRSGARYSLVASTGSCSLEMTVTWKVDVSSRPSMPGMDVEYRGRARRRADLRVHAPLTVDIGYEWSSDGFASLSHTGVEWKGVSVPREGLDLALRAINGCGQVSASANQHLSRPAPGKKGQPFRFLNIGVLTHDVSQLGNLRCTIGSTRFHGTMVFNISRLIGGSGHMRTLEGRSLEVDDGGRVTNFPAGIGSYYTVNGQVMSVRSGILLGTTIGRGPVRAQVGLGLGSRSLYWGLDVGSYSATAVRKVWAENTAASWQGAAAEVGVFIDLSPVNLMFGIQSVIDPARPVPYVEAAAGIGIRLKK